MKTTFISRILDHSLIRVNSDVFVTITTLISNIQIFSAMVCIFYDNLNFEKNTALRYLENLARISILDTKGILSNIREFLFVSACVYIITLSIIFLRILIFHLIGKPSGRDFVHNTQNIWFFNINVLYAPTLFIFTRVIREYAEDVLFMFG